MRFALKNKYLLCKITALSLLSSRLILMPLYIDFEIIFLKHIFIHTVDIKINVGDAFNIFYRKKENIK